ncbi:MAG: hypothetical protein ABR587_05615 [Candidatus Binatia bacterium]
MKLPAVLLTLAFILVAKFAGAADWTPAAWTDEETLQFRTDCPDEAEHWSYVWLVVLDGDVWVRLGAKAGGRVDCSKTKPLAAVKIAGQEFASVEMVNVPEMAERVAAAMGEKYMTDIFVRYMDHPYTMKLVPKTE